MAAATARPRLTRTAARSWWRNCAIPGKIRTRSGYKRPWPPRLTSQPPPASAAQKRVAGTCRTPHATSGSARAPTYSGTHWLPQTASGRQVRLNAGATSWITSLTGMPAATSAGSSTRADRRAKSTAGAHWAADSAAAPPIHATSVAPIRRQSAVSRVHCQASHAVPAHSA